MNEARIGFVGCGTHATNNIFPMLMYARSRLVATCDLNADLAARNARLFGGERSYTDVDQMLDKERLDGVMCVGPFDLHYTVAKKVLSRGLPIFVEKPTAPTLEQTIELTKLAKSKNTFIMTAFMKRYGLTYGRVKREIDAGRFVPAAGFFKYAHWAGMDLRLVLVAMSSHIINLSINFFGPVKQVISAKHTSSRTSSLAVTLRHTGGQLSQLWLDGSQPRIQERVEISGSVDGKNALFVIDDVDHLEFHKQDHGGVDVIAPSLAEIKPEFVMDDIQLWRPDNAIPNCGQTRHFIQGFAYEVRDFCECVIEKREPFSTMIDAIRTMQIIELIHQNPDGVHEVRDIAI